MTHPYPGGGGSHGRPQAHLGAFAGIPHHAPIPQLKNLGRRALIASVFFCCAVAWLYSVVVGIRALVRTRRTGVDHGKRFAIVALCIDGVVLVLFIAGVVVGGLADMLAKAERDASGNVVEAGTESVFSLRVGDCLTEPPINLSNGATTDAGSADVTPCSTSHTGEVYAVLALEGPFPGLQAAQGQAEEECSDELGGFAPGPGIDPDAVQLEYFWPQDARQWDEVHKTVCTVVLVSGTTLGPIVESAPSDAPSDAPEAGA